MKEGNLKEFLAQYGQYYGTSATTEDELNEEGEKYAKNAAAILPAVPGILEADVALDGIEGGHGVAAVGIFAAIEAAPGKEAGDLRHGDTVDLLMKDVIQPLLKIGNLVRQAYDQALGDLPQKDAGLGRRVQKLGAGVPKQLLGQQVQHGVGDLGRGEHLVVAQVGQAGEDIRIVVGGIEVRHLARSSCMMLLGIPARAWGGPRW